MFKVFCRIETFARRGCSQPGCCGLLRMSCRAGMLGHRVHISRSAPNNALKRTRVGTDANESAYLARRLARPLGGRNRESPLLREFSRTISGGVPVAEPPLRFLHSEAILSNVKLE